MALLFVWKDETIVPVMASSGHIIDLQGLNEWEPNVEDLVKLPKEHLIDIASRNDGDGIVRNDKTDKTRRKMTRQDLATYIVSNFGSIIQKTTSAKAMFAHRRKVSEELDKLLRPADDDDEGSDGSELPLTSDDEFLYFAEIPSDDEVIDKGTGEDKVKVVLKTKVNSHQITLYFQPSQTVNAVVNEIAWLTELDGAYTLVGQNTGKAWALEQTIASLSVDDFTAYIQLKLKGGGKRGIGGKSKADKESKVKELTEKIGVALLRIEAGKPPNFIQDIVNNIVMLKERLGREPDLILQGLHTLTPEQIKVLQIGLGASHSYVRVSAVTKALYPAQQLQLDEVGKLCNYLTEAMNGFVELCILSRYGNDDGTLQWAKLSGDLVEIVSNISRSEATGGSGSTPSRGLGY